MLDAIILEGTAPNGGASSNHVVRLVGREGRVAEILFARRISWYLYIFGYACHSIAASLFCVSCWQLLNQHFACVVRSFLVFGAFGESVMHQVCRSDPAPSVMHQM